MTSPLRNLPMGVVPNEVELDGAEGCSDGASSVLEPYIEGVTDTSFPSYCILEKGSTMAQIYTRSMFSQGNGVALYDGDVSDSSRHNNHIERGALIGDVGCMNRDGSFNYCFNLFFPKDHSIQTRYIPPNFTPLPSPPAEDVLEISNYFAPGTVMASEGVEVRRISESPLEVEFISSAAEAAVLVLPTGASRQELTNTSSILPYLRDHVPHWYLEYNGPSDEFAHSPLANGTLWVVVGVDRADSWARATLPNGSDNVGKRVKFTYKQPAKSESVWKNEKKIIPDYGLYHLTDKKGAIFLRVLSVALGPEHWDKNIAHILPSQVPYYTVLPALSLGKHSWIQRIFSSRPGSSPSSNGRPIFFHPSLILLHILLLTNSTVDVGVVADSVWCSQSNALHLTHLEVVRLIHRIIQHYDIVTTDGVATFVPRSKLPTRRQNLVAYITRVLPWLSKDLRTIAHRNAAKVLGI